MASSWTVGGLSEADLVVSHPSVSGRHCRLTLDEDGYHLEDLRSRNGTYVNGRRITEKVGVTRGDAITLGLTVPMPWPPESAAPGPDPVQKVLRIGREPDNDVVIELPIVSGHHARIVWDGRPGGAMIEDLGSANGTAIGSPDRRVSRSALSASDTIYLGNHPVPAAGLLARLDPSIAPPLHFRGAEMVIGRDPGCHRVVDTATVSGRHARLSRSGNRVLLEDLGSANGTFVNGHRVVGTAEVKAGDLIVLGRDPFRLTLDPTPASEGRPHREWAGLLARPAWLLGLLVQAPILALAIGLVSRAGASGGVASALFWLGMASLWFGLSGSAVGSLVGPRSADLRGFASSWAILGTLCVFQCALALIIVTLVVGLRGPVFWSMALLVLASGVGLALGSLIVLLAPRPSAAWPLFGLAVMSLWLLGGGPWSLPRTNLPVRVASGAVPSRWAFEGLLLLESARRPVGPGRDRDPAEAYFPAGADRMGPRADALALGSMLVGLVGASVFLIRDSGKGP